MYGHPPPGRVALDEPLVTRDAALGRPLLELHGVASREHRAVDELARDFERAVVIDPDFRDDQHAVALADHVVSDPNAFVAHHGLLSIEDAEALRVGRARYQAVHPPSTTRLNPVR